MKMLQRIYKTSRLMNKKNHLFFLILFSFTHTVFADFTLSGTTITQTGTDADLSGLDGIAGVTVTDFTTHKIYSVVGLVLRVDGTMTIDPEVEQLVFDTTSPAQTIVVNSGGVLNVGLEQTYGNPSQTYYSGNTAIIFTRNQGSQWLATSAMIRALSGGAFNMYGGVIKMSGGNIWMNSGSTQIWRDATFVCDDRTARLYVYSGSNADVDGLTVWGFNTVNNETNADLKRMKVINSLWAIFVNSIAIDTTIESFEKIATEYDGVTDNANRYNYINRVGGSTDFISSARYTNSAIQKRIQIRGYQRIKFSVKDATGNAIEGVETFIRDTVDANAYDNSYPTYAENFTDERTYNATTNVSGETPDQLLLTYAVIQDASSPTVYTVVSPNTVAPVSYRSDSGTDTDDFTVHFFHYNYDYAPTTFFAKDGSDKTVNWTLFDDPNITQTTKATVDAYTTIDNLDQLYDRAKSWKVDAANVEYPTVSTQPITGANSVLDLGAMDLVVDASAGSAFAVNTTTNTITINSTALGVGSKFTGLTTTGAVSTANAATLEFGYNHSGGRVKYIEIRGLTDSDISITDNVPATAVSLATGTNITGTFKASFNAPTDESNTQILVSRTYYTSFAQLFPAANLTFISSPLLILGEGLENNQLIIINNTLKLLQKTEAIRNSYLTTPPANPTLTVNIVGTTNTGAATEGNQEKIIDILKRVLSKVTVIREAQR